MRKTLQTRSSAHNLPRPWMTLGSAPTVDSNSNGSRSLAVELATVEAKPKKALKNSAVTPSTSIDTVVTNFTTTEETKLAANKGSILLNGSVPSNSTAPSPAALHSQWEDPVLVHVDDYLQRSVRLQKKMYDKYRRVTKAEECPPATATPSTPSKGGKKKKVSVEAYDPASDTYVTAFDADKCGVVEMEVRLGQLGFTRNVTVDARNQSLWESTAEDTAEKKTAATVKKTVNAHTNEETANSNNHQAQQQKHKQLQAQKRQGFRVATAPIESAAVLENNTYMFNSGFKVLSSCDEFFSIPYKLPFRHSKKRGFTILCVERATRRANTKGIRKVIGFNMWARLFTQDLPSQKRAWLAAAYNAAFISVDERSYEEVRKTVDDYLRVSQPERYSETAMSARADSAENRAAEDSVDDFDAADAMAANTAGGAGEEGEEGEDDLVSEGGIPQTREEAITVCREHISRKVRTFSFAATEAATAAQLKLQQSQQAQKSTLTTSSTQEDDEATSTNKLLMTSEEAEDHQAMRMKELLKGSEDEIRELRKAPKERFVGVSTSHEDDIPKDALTWKQRRQFDLLVRRPGEIAIDGVDEIIHPPVTWGRVGAVTPAEFQHATGANLGPKKPDVDSDIINLPPPDVLHPKHLNVGTTFEAHALTDDGYRLEFTGGVPLAAVLDAKSNQLSILLTSTKSSTSPAYTGPTSPACSGCDSQSSLLIEHLRAKYEVEEIIFDSFVIESGKEQAKYSYIRNYVSRKLKEGDVAEIDTRELMLLPRRRPLDTVAAPEAEADKGGFGGGGTAKRSKPLADSLLIKDVAIDFSAPIKKKSEEQQPSTPEASIFNVQPTTPVDLYLLKEHEREQAAFNADEAEAEALFSAPTTDGVVVGKDTVVDPRPSTLESGSFIGGESTLIAFTDPRTVRKSTVSHFDIRQPRWCADARISVSIERTHEESTGETLPHPAKMVPSDTDMLVQRPIGTDEEEHEWGLRMGRSIAVTRLRKRMMFNHFRVMPVLSGITVGLTSIEPAYQPTIARIAAATQKLSPLLAPHVLHATSGSTSAKKTTKATTPEALAQATGSYESLMSPEDLTYGRVVKYFAPFLFHSSQQPLVETTPCRRLLRWNFNNGTTTTPATVKRQTASYPSAVEFELGRDIIADEFLRPCITDVVTQRRPRPLRTRLPSHATTVKQLQEEYGVSDKKELLALMKEKEDSIGHIPGSIRAGAAEGMMCMRTHPTDERSREVEVEVDVAALTKTIIAADRALEHRISLIEGDTSIDADTKSTVLTFVRHEHNQRVADLYRVVSRCFMETIGDIAKIT